MSSTNLLGLRGIDEGTITSILEQAITKKHDFLSGEPIHQTLAGKRIVLLFYENSTRTRLSFEIAARLLGAEVINISAESSSVQKGESFLDTVKTIQTMQVDCIVIRHPLSGVLHQASRHVHVVLVNAGDGTNEHPTQALLDLMTLQENIGPLQGKKVLIIGDILHSRVARSDIWGLKIMGAKISVYGPREWIPKEIIAWGIEYEENLEKAVRSSDAVIALRIQKERQDGGTRLSFANYNSLYGLNEQLFADIERKPIIMHPGPVNRGIELTSGLIDGPLSRISEQVLNGVAIRAAVLNSLMGG